MNSQHLQLAEWPDEPKLAEIAPCRICNERCPSQLESLQSNNGFPWATCSGCHESHGDEGCKVYPAERAGPTQSVQTLIETMPSQTIDTNNNPDVIARKVVQRWLGKISEPAKGHLSDNDRENLEHAISASIQTERQSTDPRGTKAPNPQDDQNNAQETLKHTPATQDPREHPVTDI